MSGSDERRELLIVSGMSGAGRSTVAKALEDLGWYVVDNLPPLMLRPLTELAERAGSAIPKLAAVIDVRGGKLFSNIQETIASFRDSASVRMLFLEANDAVLVRRFEQVRRPHPLQGQGTLLDGIAAERTLLAEVRAASDLIIDTSDLNIHQLSTAVHDQFADEGTPGVTVTVTSFGFKYGLPADADLVVDARFLPNPFWEPSLRDLTGLDARVRDHVLSQPGAMEFVTAYIAALAPVLAGYQRENKRHVTIAVGCTGGKHRSVAITEELAQRLRAEPGLSVRAKHRDLGRE